MKGSSKNAAFAPEADSLHLFFKGQLTFTRLTMKDVKLKEYRHCLEVQSPRTLEALHIAVFGLQCTKACSMLDEVIQMKVICASSWLDAP